jgi:superfamily II DNA helicase RecQ
MTLLLSSQSIEKLMALHTTWQAWFVLQLLLEWLGEPTLSEIQTAFSSITNTPLSAETLPALLHKQWVEQPHPQAPISLTLLGLKSLKQWQKAWSHTSLQAESPNLLERDGLKPSPTPVAEKATVASVEKPTVLPPPPAFLIRTPKLEPAVEKIAKKAKSPITETLEVPTEEALTEAHWGFYETLREARWYLAEKEAVKPYRICSNAVLRSLAVHQPTDYPALEKLQGVGKAFIEKYAPTFISLTAAHMLK